MLCPLSTPFEILIAPKPCESRVTKRNCELSHVSGIGAEPSDVCCLAAIGRGGGAGRRRSITPTSSDGKDEPVSELETQNI
jgi:hypothetical protein